MPSANSQSQGRLTISSYKGIAHYVYVFLKAILPLILLGLVEARLTLVAVALVALGKWRVFAVKPYYWVTNIIANSIDLSVGISTVYFLWRLSGDIYLQLLVTLAYTLWLTMLKPKSGPSWSTFHALAGQALTVAALFDYATLSDATRGFPQVALISFVGVEAYVASRHLLNNFQEKFHNALSAFWAITAMELAWIVDRWATKSWFIVTGSALITIFAYSLSQIYIESRKDEPSNTFRLMHVAFMFSCLVILILFSDFKRNLY
jgi:hypothetical protein